MVQICQLLDSSKFFSQGLVYCDMCHLFVDWITESPNFVNRNREFQE